MGKTKIVSNQQKEIKKHTKNPPQGINSPEALSDLLNLLSKVDLKAKEAKLNGTSISDNNGGRISL